MAVKILFTLLIAEFSLLALGCMSSTSTVPITGEPGDVGAPGAPSQIYVRGKREIDVTQNLLYIMTQETNFKKAEKLIDAEREALLAKLKPSKSIFNALSPSLEQPLVFSNDGGYLTSVITLDLLEEWKMCYFFAEKVMLLNNEKPEKDVKLVVTCNNEQFY